MSPQRPRWWRRRPVQPPVGPPAESAGSLSDLDDQLALAARLLRDARERGHHNQAEKLRGWIDELLDKRSALVSR